VISRAEAQSFDRVAADYDRLGDLDRRDWMEQWLVSVLAGGGRRALDLDAARQRVGGRRGVAVIWDAPLPPAGSGKTC
jgi:hypothetical protein